MRRIEDAIRETGGPVLAVVELVDIYRGEPIPVGSKSVAFRLIYQSPKRELREKEITSLRKRIIKAVERETGGKLRQ